MNIVKRLKFIIVGVFIFLTVLFCGEWYQHNFNVLPTNIIEFYANEDFDTMKADLSEAAEKNSVNIAFIDRKIVSTRTFSVKIYADEKTQRYFTESIKLSPGSVKSLISGEIKTEFFPFYQFLPESENKRITLHLIGGSDNLEGFWYDLEDQYNLPYPEKQSIRKTNTGLVYFSALALFTLLLCILLSYYEYSFSKKEYFVKMTLGENIVHDIFKSILLDSFVYFMIWSLARFVITLLGSQKLFEAEQIMLLFAVIAVNDSFPLLHLKLNNKKTTNTKFFSATVGTIKVISMILTCLTVSLFFSQLKNNVSYYSQKSFYEEYKNAYWYNAINVPDGEIEDSYMNAFYTEHYDDMNIYVAYEYISLPQSKESAFLINGNAFEYLAAQNSEIADIDMTSNKYIFIKRDKKLSDVDKQEIKEWVKSEKSIIYYDNDIELVALINDNYHAEPETRLIKNPIIVFENAENKPMSFYTKWLISTDKAVLQQFAEENDIAYSETNALEFFNLTVKENNRILYLYLVLSVLLICVELFNTVLSVKLKYALEPIELTVKQVTGYSSFERFKGIYILTAVSWIVAFITSCIIFKSSIGFTVASTLLVLLADLVLTKLCIDRKDKINIYTILKGGII